MNAESFETVVVETDLLILGGGMAACGAAYEAAYWAKKNKKNTTRHQKISYNNPPKELFTQSSASPE